MKRAARPPRIETALPAVTKEDGEVESNEDKPKFWRYPSEARDRYGEWLEANLPAIRAETIERGEGTTCGYGVVPEQRFVNYEHLN